MSKFTALYESIKFKKPHSKMSEEDLVKQASEISKLQTKNFEDMQDLELDISFKPTRAKENKLAKLDKLDDKLSDQFIQTIKPLWKMDSELASKHGLFDGLDDSILDEVQKG